MVRAMTVLAALAALLLAGCGGSSDKDAYVKEFNGVSVTLEKTLDSIGADITTGTKGPQIAAKLDQGARALDNAATDFSTIKTPSDVKSAHAHVVAGLKQLAGVFREGATAARNDDVAKLVDTLRNLNNSPGAKQIQQAQQELKDKGYKVRGT
jgi:uncharacterized lipoprotein